MDTVTLSPISPTILVAIGIFLIALEAMVFNFVLFWFGLAAIIVGIFSLVFHFTDGLWQLADIAIVSLMLLLTLRTKALTIFLKSKDGDEVKDDFLNEKGIGVVKNNKIYYKATYWECDDIDKLKNGQKVAILEAKKGKVRINATPDRDSV